MKETDGQRQKRNMWIIWKKGEAEGRRNENKHNGDLIEILVTL